MTPEQALQILDQAASLAPMSRRDHMAVQEASETLRKMILEEKQTKTIEKSLHQKS